VGANEEAGGKGLRQRVLSVFVRWLCVQIRLFWSPCAVPRLPFCVVSAAWTGKRTRKPNRFDSAPLTRTAIVTVGI